MISIIVPIYNSEKYLNDCLESLSKLDKNNFEIILINDGSNDNSEKICMHFYRQNTNFRYFYQDNRGVSFARNKGIELAKGEYVIFVDSDDVIISDNLNHLKNINSDLVFATDKKIDDNLSKKQLLLSLFNDKYFNFRSVWSKIYKKSVIIDNKIYFNTKLINGEDFIFNLYFYNKCRDYSIFNKSIYDYRLNDSSCSFSFNKNIVENEIEFFSILESSIESFSLEIDILKLNSIRVCLNKYFFNKKNSQKLKMKINELEIFINNKIYLDAIKNKKAYKYLDKKTKLILLLLKYKFYIILSFIFFINNNLKRK